MRLEFVGECICLSFKFPGEGVHENLDERFEGSEDHLEVSYVNMLVEEQRKSEHKPGKAKTRSG